MDSFRTNIHLANPRKTGHKRPFDIAVLLVAHLCPPMIPVWIVIWIAIPLAIWLEDGGPIFYRQQRAGKNRRDFDAIKFRTMIVDADSSGLVTLDGDSRVTRVGRVLRRTALDELPQVINILRGEMSFVGPRALPVGMHEYETSVEPRFPERLQVTPGLTGLAQMYLPRHCAARRRLRYDLLYIERAGLWLDVRLMLLAAFKTLTASWGQGQQRMDQRE